MRVKDLDENLNYAFASLLLWVNCARAPMSTCQSLLDSGLSDEQKMHQAARVWLVATMIGLVCQIPIYGLLGIDWKRVEFYLPGVLFLLLAFLMTVAVLHAGFRIFGINSRFADTLILYSVLLGTYSPLLQIFLLPSMYEVLAALKAVKAPGLGIREVAEAVFADLASPEREASILGVYKLISGVGLNVVSLFLIVFFVHCCAALYGVHRSRAVVATGFAMGLLYPLPFAAILLLYYSTIYAAI